MKESPSVDQWLKEAKADESAPRCGMYLTHNGTVRELPKKLVRQGIDDGTKVVGMNFSYDEAGVEAARQEALQMPGIEYVRVWLNEGSLQVGDDIMYVLIGGDIRPNVVDCLQALVGKIKNEMVSEVEIAEEIGMGGAGALKKYVTESVNEHFAPIRARREELVQDMDYVKDVLHEGNRRANEVAEATLAEVREAMGMVY